MGQRSDWQLICFARDKSSGRLFMAFQPMWQKKWREAHEWQNTTQHNTDCRCSNNSSLKNHKHKKKYRVNIGKPYLFCHLSSLGQIYSGKHHINLSENWSHKCNECYCNIDKIKSKIQRPLFHPSILKSVGLKVQRLRAACNESLMISPHQISHVGIQLSFYFRFFFSARIF